MPPVEQKMLKEKQKQKGLGVASFKFQQAYLDDLKRLMKNKGSVPLINEAEYIEFLQQAVAEIRVARNLFVK